MSLAGSMGRAPSNTAAAASTNGASDVAESSTRSAPIMTRATSYVLVSSSLPEPPEEPVYITALPSRRPRYHYLLPLLAAVDFIATCTLAYLLISRTSEDGGRPSPHPGDGSQDPPAAAPYWDSNKMVLTVAAVAALRASTFAIVGFSWRMHELGVVVAAVCILSALYNVSVANILFQARGKPDIVAPAPKQPPHRNNLTSSLVPMRTLAAFEAFDGQKGPSIASVTAFTFAVVNLAPTFAFLIGSQMAFTLAEWMLYIAIVGVRVPPGANPIKAKRWARTLASEQRHNDGVDAASLYLTDSDNDADDDDEEDEADEDAGTGRESVEPEPSATTARRERSLDAEQPPSASLREGRGSRPTSPLLAMAAELSNPGSDAAGRKDVDSERTLLRSPNRGYGAASVSAHTPTRKQSLATQGSVRSNKGRAGTRSPIVPFPSGRDSPRTAELGLVGRRLQDLEDGSDGDEDDLDPNDIIDISSDRRLSRHASRRRLALAAHPERRISGSGLGALSLGLGGVASGGTSKPLGIGGGSGFFARQKADGRTEAAAVTSGGLPRSWTSSNKLGVPMSGGDATPHRSVSVSASQHPAASEAASAAAGSPPTAAAQSKKHRKLPAWLSRSKTSPAKSGGSRHAAAEGGGGGRT